MILTIICFTCVFATCKKKCIGTDFTFSLGAKAIPNQDTLKLGDTLFFEVKDSVILQDLSSSKLVDYSNASNLTTVISTNKIVSENPLQKSNALSLVEFKITVGSEIKSIDSSRFKEYFFQEINNAYVLRFL